MIKLTDGNFVEYVHIATGSSCVKVRDVVAAGDVICRSGDVGFCPTPHLHLQVTASSDAKSTTIPFAFAPSGGTGAPFVPRAGSNYSSAGPV